MLIQFIIIIFVIFAWLKLFLKLKNKEISLWEATSWTIFWLIVCLAALWPKNLDRVAQFFGVYRGADLALYFSVITLFYLIFRLFTKLEKIERDIVKIVREIALGKKEEK